VSGKQKRTLSIAGATCLLLAATLLASPSPGDDKVSSAPNPERRDLQAPKPLPVYRKELPGAFTKASPASIADLKAMQAQVEGLVTRLSPTVVAVEIGYANGSGVIISADGLVLTAGHVCGRSGRNVLFTFPDGKTAHGKTLGVDLDCDTGLMRITDPGPWPHAPMGELAQAEIGDWVLALGHPGGFDPKRSLVVRLGRIIRLAPDALQTDCTIAPGDSGGPLFDMHGRIIAIHSAISSSVEENFHVTITEFYTTWQKLVKAQIQGNSAEPPLAYFGGTVEDEGGRCRLSRIEENSPALKAGLRVGDLLLKVDKREIKAPAAFRRWVAEAQPGETLSLEIKRGAKLLSLDVKLQAQPGSPR